MSDMRIHENALQTILTHSRSRAGDGQEKAGFGDFLSRSLSEVNHKIVAADEAAAKLATGRDASIPDTMIKLEEANISLQLVMKVRNKVLEAYNQIMRMQI